MNTTQVRAALKGLIKDKQRIFNNKRANGRTIKVYMVNPRNREAIVNKLIKLGGHNVKVIRSHVWRRFDCNVVYYSVSAQFWSL